MNVYAVSVVTTSRRKGTKYRSEKHVVGRIFKEKFDAYRFIEKDIEKAGFMHEDFDYEVTPIGEIWMKASLDIEESTGLVRYVITEYELE